MSSPKISVVISAYQKATFIANTIDSVLRQTITDIEIIVVDDGSTDNTREIVEVYAAVDPRIAYIYQNNRGPGSARNTGIRNSRGSLIALLDGDDTWMPDKLAKQLQVLQHFPEIDLLFTDVNYVDLLTETQNSNVSDSVRRYLGDCIVEGHGTTWMLGGQRFSSRILMKNVFILSSVIFRRRVWDTVSGFDEQFKGPEDLDFWVRAALHDFLFAYLDDKTVVYQKNSTSLVQRNEQTYTEQLRHAIYAYQSPEYEHIHGTAKKLVKKRFRQLARLYSFQRRPERTLKVLAQSAKYGIDFRILLLLLASFWGAGLFRLYARVQHMTRSSISYRESSE